MIDIERIYLEPLCCADQHGDRQWCEDDVWPHDDCESHSPALQYVRADIVEARLQAARNEAIEQERAVIVAWLRSEFVQANSGNEGHWLADAIEVGEHLTQPPSGAMRK